MTKSRNDYLDGMVFGMEGLALTEVGWTVTNTPASPSSTVFYRDSLPAAEGLAPSDYLGPGMAPMEVPTGHQMVMLPKAFPLSFGHGIPTGLVFAADIGSRDFRLAMKEISSSASDTAWPFVQWIEDCSLFHEFLDAVARNALSFAVPCIARESIAEALSSSSATYPTVSDHSLLPFTWVEMGVARRLHRDGIFASLKDSHATLFRNFEG